MNTLKEIGRNNVVEIVSLVKNKKIECMIVFIILACSVIVGWLTSNIIDSGRNGIIRFYIGGTFSFFVFFASYWYIEQLIKRKPAEAKS